MYACSLIKSILCPEKKYLQAKFNDYRKISIAMSILCSCGCTSLWIWDHVIDPAGAQSTILLRLSMFVMGLIYTFALKRHAYSLWVPAAMFSTTISWEVIFVNILNRLDTGMIYGISGFMFFMLLPLIMMQGLPTRVNVLYILVTAAIPQLLAAAGFAEGFQHRQYAVLIWFEAVMAIIIQLMVKMSYLARYNTQQQLELAATIDKATGVTNRNCFMDNMESSLQSVRASNMPLSLILLDIDDFKSINDKFGHPAGDKVIKELADLCRNEIGHHGIVGRLGGEEFCALLPCIDEAQAVDLAEHLRAKTESAAVVTEQGVIRFTCSLGVAELKADDTVEDIYVRVDNALYKSKNTGRNRVHIAE